MKINTPHYLKQFKCRASACEDTCCAGWEVGVDEGMQGRYQKLQGALGGKLRSRMKEDEEGIIFELEGENCPFLTGEKLCEIHQTLGEDYLCHTCKEFPRYTQTFLSLKEIGISLSCEEAAKIILEQRGEMVFEQDEDDEEAEVDEWVTEDTLALFLTCRDCVFALLENRAFDLGTRLALGISFAEAIQQKIDEDEMESLESICNQYRSQTFLETKVTELKQVVAEDEAYVPRLYHYVKTYSELQHMHENDPLALNKTLARLGTDKAGEDAYLAQQKRFNGAYPTLSEPFKNITHYFVFRYMMRSIFDYNIVSKVKLAVMSTVIIQMLAVTKWLEEGTFTEEMLQQISSQYSKDIEHLEENIESLQETFEQDECYMLEVLVGYLMQIVD